MRINISAKRRNTLRIPSDKGIFRPKRAFLGDNSSAPFGYTMNVDWDEVLIALAETDYDGDFTFETSFFNKYPEELYPDALKLLCKMGRYMVEKITEYKRR